MATSAYLDTSALQLAPGGSAQCRVAVTNHGSVVESYSLRVTGDLAPFATVDRQTMTLYPDTEGQVTVTFRIPEDAPVQAGEVPFAVVVEPHERPEEVAVPEGVVSIAAHDALTAELTPRTSHGRRGARHTLAVDNRGNRAVTLAFAGKDPDGLLGFTFRPERLRVAPGTAGFASVGVRAIDRIWRGPSMTRTFSLSAVEVASGILPGDHDRESDLAAISATPIAAVDGTMVQDATLPPWFNRAVVAGLLGVAALVAVWFLVLRPTIESTAEKVVAEPLRQVSKQAGEASQAAEQAKQDASAAQQQAGSASDAADKTKTDQQRQQDEQAAQTQALAGKPFNRRFAVDAGAGHVSTATYTVAKGQVLRVTDLVLESPGDIGRLEVRRGTQVMLAFQTETFRDLDQHYVSPIIYTEGEQLVVRLSCTKAAPGDGSTCKNAVYVGGSLAPKAAAKPKPAPEAAGG